MIIDAHTHTYPETIAKRAIEKLEKNSGTKAHTNGIMQADKGSNWIWVFIIGIPCFFLSLRQKNR
jgi:hypothetical protein